MYICPKGTLGFGTTVTALMKCLHTHQRFEKPNQGSVTGALLHVWDDPVGQQTPIGFLLQHNPVECSVRL